MIDAQVGYEWEQGKYRLSLEGTNLTDKVTWTQGVSTLGRYIGQPRLVSLTFGARFQEELRGIRRMHPDQRLNRLL